MIGGFAIRQVDGEIARRFAIGQEVLLDCPGLETEQQDELVVARVRIGLHDVPHDGFAADVDHWLWQRLRCFANASSLAASEDNDRDVGRID